jgi:hypothetical protein
LFDQCVPKNSQLQRHLPIETPSDGIVPSFVVLYLNEKFLSNSVNPVKHLKFIYSEKATKFCLLLSVCTVVKSKGKISRNFVAFLEFINFTYRSTPLNLATKQRPHFRIR